MRAELPANRPLRLGEIARFLGWQKTRTRRYLLRMQERHPEHVFLRNTKGTPLVLRPEQDRAGDSRSPFEGDGGWWEVTSLTALQKVWPDFGKAVYGAEDVARERAKVVELEKQVKAMRARLRALEGLVRRVVPAVEQVLSKGTSGLQEALESSTRGISG